MRKILIVGAHSAIAQACARQFAQAGHQLFLVARNQLHLDLQIRGAQTVGVFQMDVNDIASIAPMLAQAQSELSGLDTVLIAHGTLPDQALCQTSIENTLREIDNNALSVIALLTPIAELFEEQKRGSIAVISSVAGDRGRASNYVYGSAKAMVTTFLSGLRQRLAKSHCMSAIPTCKKTLT
jgi:NADP-dependent 3-hydroxy acid dehydrogenase YdfG